LEEGEAECVDPSDAADKEEVICWRRIIRKVLRKVADPDQDPKEMTKTRYDECGMQYVPAKGDDLVERVGKLEAMRDCLNTACENEGP